ncbi:uncharacterized protein LOC132723862 [Ruditapes philippinarum]|uniref:uncharacterized protein LOC132723862 n=1 Tax=Ruditapes philippinarum TaxID=129788 RepID=UPI00295AFC62|nr:uncharacterized protein LOC132723862 [Ruditapes philippinarum]
MGGSGSKSLEFGSLEKNEMCVVTPITTYSITINGNNNSINLESSGIINIKRKVKKDFFHVFKKKKKNVDTDDDNEVTVECSENDVEIQKDSADESFLSRNSSEKSEGVLSSDNRSIEVEKQQYASYERKNQNIQPFISSLKETELYYKRNNSHLEMDNPTEMDKFETLRTENDIVHNEIGGTENVQSMKDLKSTESIEPITCNDDSFRKDVTRSVKHCKNQVKRQFDNSTEYENYSDSYHSTMNRSVKIEKDCDRSTSICTSCGISSLLKDSESTNVDDGIESSDLPFYLITPHLTTRKSFDFRQSVTGVTISDSVYPSDTLSLCTSDYWPSSSPSDILQTTDMHYNEKLLPASETDNCLIHQLDNCFDQKSTFEKDKTVEKLSLCDIGNIDGKTKELESAREVDDIDECIIKFGSTCKVDNIAENAREFGSTNEDKKIDDKAVVINYIPEMEENTSDTFCLDDVATLDMVEIFYMVLENGNTCIDLRDISFLVYVDFRTLSPVVLKSLEFLQTVSTDICEFENVHNLSLCEALTHKSVCRKSFVQGGKNEHSIEEEVSCNTENREPKVKEDTSIDCARLSYDGERTPLERIKSHHSSSFGQEQDSRTVMEKSKVNANKLMKDREKSSNKSNVLSRRKEVQQKRQKDCHFKGMVNGDLSDSSLEDSEYFGKNSCAYCKIDLDIKNNKCKHHKKIRSPFNEVDESGNFENNENKLFTLKQTNIDSGISSSGPISSFEQQEKLTRFRKKKNERIKKKKNEIQNGKILKGRKLQDQSWCFNINRQIAKQVVREIYLPPRSFPAFGLGSYFDRFRNGLTPTTQERMQYEWLRLSTFHNYEGNGNAIVLARNGFYHDHTEGPTSTRCFLCEARNSNWEMFANVSSEHRRQSPNCPFHENSGQESVNVSITYEDNVTGSSAAPPTTTSGSTPTVTVTSSASSVATAAVNEALRSLQIGQASSHGAESISQQPTEDRESDRSMLALSQPRTLRALGRTGHSYASIMAPTRNNVASGARSNVGVDPGRDVSRSTSSQIPGIRPSSILGGPVGAGAFAGLNSSGLTPVSRAKENLQQSNVPTPAVEAATGARQSNPAPGAGGRTDPNITVVVDNPKHPDYVNVESRVNTYQGWPDYLDQTPRQMSEAGFFFVGVADFTRCFCCGGGLRNWEPGDDPVLEHTRWFPRCEYINKLKGERYVAAVQRRHEQHMAEQQRQQTELAQRRDESRNDPDPLTIEAAIQLQDMGYSAERTRQAVIAVRQQTGQSIPTTEQVLTWLLDNEERENGSGMTTEFGVRPQPSETSAVATTVVGTSVPSSTISTPTTIVGTSIPTSIVNTGFGIPTTIVGTSVPTSIVGTSIPSSILNAGTSFESSSTFYTGFNAPSTLVESVSIIGTPNVHTISSTSSSTSQVGAGTTTSTVSSTSTSATAKVQPSVASATAEGVTEGSSSATGSENNSGSNEAKGSNTEKQSAASGDSDESKQTAKDPSSNEPSNKSNKKKNGKKKAKMKPKSDTAGATGGDVDAQSLKAENEKLKEMQTCKICMERPVSTTLLPCGHLVCCETCAGRLQRCPICRKRIKGTVKTFMS